MSGRAGTRLPDADLERLRLALGRSEVDVTRSLFGPDSVTWRINREAVLLLGGGCALLMQVAHPLVAAGVGAHSKYRTEPLQRLWRTLERMLTIVFADAAAAIHAVRIIERKHARVRGTLPGSAGPYLAGTAYDANDAELLFWVHATLVDTAVRVYERFIAPLPPAAKATYYAESSVTARLFGIPDACIPRTWRDFQRYMKTMVHGDALTVTAAGRGIADSILTPPLPLGVKQLFQLPGLLTIGLLPAPLRERYGYAWGPVRATALATATRTTRLLLPALPAIVRYLPQARAGWAREARRERQKHVPG